MTRTRWVSKSSRKIWEIHCQTAKNRSEWVRDKKSRCRPRVIIALKIYLTTTLSGPELASGWVFSGSRFPIPGIFYFEPDKKIPKIPKKPRKKNPENPKIPGIGLLKFLKNLERIPSAKDFYPQGSGFFLDFLPSGYPGDFFVGWVSRQKATSGA